MTDLVFIDMTSVVVKYSHRLDKSRLLQYGKIISDLPQIQTLFLRLHLKDDKSEQIAEIARFEGVLSVTFDKQRSVRSMLHSVPTDTMRTTNDAIYQEMNLYNAWDITTGDPRIKIAVLDSGCDMQHPDINVQSGSVCFQGVESTNKGFPLKVHMEGILAPEMSWNPNFDGYWIVEPVKGILKKPFTEIPALRPITLYQDSTCKTPLSGPGVNVSYPQASTYLGEAWVKEPFALFYAGDPAYWAGIYGRLEMWDGHGHGTAICGLISSPHNDNGFAGIAPDCTTTPYKMVNDFYTVGEWDIIYTVTKAADDGNHVLSCSFGGPSFPQVLIDAFTYAYNKGCISVIACGNKGAHWNEDVDTDALDYPAALSTTIGVGACGWTEYTAANTDGHMDMPGYKHDFSRISAFSQKFPQVDIIAPGYGWIFHAPTDYSKMWLGYYYNVNSRFYSYQVDGGTSFSCPAVSAGLGLCMSRYLDKYNVTDEVIIPATAPWNFDLVRNGWLAAGAKIPVNLSNGLPATKGFGMGRFDVYNALVAV